MSLALVLGDPRDFAPAAALVAGAKDRELRAHVVSAGVAPGPDASLIEPIHVQVLLGRGSPAVREGLALMGLERELMQIRPDAIVVFGPHEVGLAAALVAAKEGIPLWYAGAGRWAFAPRNLEDIGPPGVDEDLIAVLAAGMLAPTEFAATALAGARYDVKRIWVTGPLEAETLERRRDEIEAENACADHNVKPAGYVVSSVADRSVLPGQPLPVVDVRDLAYVERMSLAADASVVITDDDRMQIEACLLGVPCLVLAPASPLRETRAVGAAKRCPADPASIALAVAEQAARTERDWDAPPMFDADVSARIIALVAPHAARASALLD
ncbi:MAG TPA: UDP-N-acetylglucosamine 2-epimerase [Actinomycetota bacterium]|nr:UDP-N-acetylglucosamine 2-epimerase [Actinomycetota bacterium]